MVDRVEVLHRVARTLDAIEDDLDRLEAALVSGRFDLPDSPATELLTSDGSLSWTDAQRWRATALLERNRDLADRLAARMREITNARLFLGDSPSHPRYLDTIA